MSLWLRYRDDDGKTQHYAIPFDPLVLVVAIGVLFGLAMAALSAFRNAVLQQPVVTAIAIGAVLVAGLVLFSIAKFSVIRTGTLITYGPSTMTPSMRYCYCVGYSLMGCAAFLVLLFFVST